VALWSVAMYSTFRRKIDHWDGREEGGNCNRYQIANAINYSRSVKFSLAQVADLVGISRVFRRANSIPVFLMLQNKCKSKECRIRVRERCCSDLNHNMSVR
jgi:hypothetical protein